MKQMGQWGFNIFMIQCFILQRTVFIKVPLCYPEFFFFNLEPSLSKILEAKIKHFLSALSPLLPDNTHPQPLSHQNFYLNILKVK